MPKSSGLVRVTCRLRNRPGSPMLMNPATPEMLEQLFKPKGARKEREQDLTMDQVAASRIYRENGPKSPVGFPIRNLLASLVAAGRLVDHTGKMKLSTREDSLVPGLLDFEKPFIAFNPNRTDLNHRTSAMRGRIPSNKVAVCIVRPEFPSWVTEDIHFTFSPADVAETKLRDELFYKAGKMIGLCDFRPSCKGPYGKYYVCFWESEELDREPLEMDKE